MIWREKMAKTSKKQGCARLSSPSRQPAEPVAETEKAPKNLILSDVDRRIARALRDVAENMQQYFGLNVVGAELQATAKRLEDGKLK
jgi:hypothetical protein